MPTTVTNFIDIPGANGQLDMSEALIGYPIYGSREGSLSFIVLNDYTNDTWAERYQLICNSIHGKRMLLMLEDDPSYYYEGRFTVDNWETPNSNDFSKIEIGYTLDPYKKLAGVTTYTNTVDSSNPKTIRFGAGGAYIGRMPACPVFQISGISNSVIINFNNPELYSDMISHTISIAATYQFPDIILTNVSGQNTCSISFNGSGTIITSLRIGEL